jgi:hypothetical protein
MGTTADGQRVYLMGERARGQGDEEMKIGSSMFSDYNDIIFCDKTYTERMNC